MRRRRHNVPGLLAITIAGTLSCSDAPAAPVENAHLPDTTRYAGMSDRQLFLAIMDRLEAIEARLDGAAGGGGGITGVNTAVTKSGTLGSEASLCATYEFRANAKMESKMRMRGGGVAGAGVDAYGNGAVAAAGLEALQELRFVPEGSEALTLQVCGKMALARTAGDPAASVTGNGGSVALRKAPSSDPASQLLRGALEALPPERLNAVASRFGMNGQRMRQGLDLVSNLSLSELPFGRGAAGSLIDVLPLPPDVAALIRSPENIVQRAGEAGQFALDRLCDQSLFTGEFAQRASQACERRNQLPSAAGLIDILNGLDGLPVTVNAMNTKLSSACNRINRMLPANVSIPSETATLPTGHVITTFSGYSKNLFAGVPDAC